MLNQHLEDSLAVIEKNLVADCQSDAILAAEISQQLLALGGKRIRARLVILAAKLCQLDNGVAIKLATILEWLHAATLLHDDVIDSADARRHKRTARLVWGNSASVLSGDFLYALAFKEIAKLNNLSAVQELSIATQMVVEGEIKQLEKRYNFYNNVDDYLEIIGGKTAKLFEVALSLPAICANSSDHKLAGLRSFGYNFGLAYQVVDDITDYYFTNAELGKVRYQDLSSGTCTLPLIVAMQNNPDLKEITASALSGDLSAQSKIKKEVCSKEVFSQCMDFAVKLQNRAIEALSDFEDLESIDLLKSLLENVLQKTQHYSL